MKKASQIIKWGKVKPFFDKTYKFNTIDIETIEIYYKNGIEFTDYDFTRFHTDKDYKKMIVKQHNLKMESELFLFGYTLEREHFTVFENFYEIFHDFIIYNVQHNKDVLTWSRYDNTHLIKMILSIFEPVEIKQSLLRIGKISPICSYQYNDFTFVIENIIKDCVIIKVIDSNGASKNCTVYNLKNLYDTDLETTANNYKIDYYSKLGKEYHLIDKKCFETDTYYKSMVIKSNKLDNIVLLDIAKNMLNTFKTISGHLPKSIFTNGSLARSYSLANIGSAGSKNLNFKMIYGKHELFSSLLDYSMKSYHGGKIESYVLGYLPKAKIIDITSAYPYAMSQLPKLTKKVIQSSDVTLIKDYYYVFINCEIRNEDMNLIHPVLVENPINKSNISPYGYMKAVITKIEYDYMIKKGCDINVIDFIAIEHENEYPYKKIVDELFLNRMKTKNTNISLSIMYKTILNSLYGITFELTDMYEEINNVITWAGYRAGDYFNPVIASYITALTRTYLSDVSHDIILNGGDVLLNMTDSIIYHGNTSLDVFSQEKILGKFEPPTLIKDVYILGAGRYEYRDEFSEKYTIKNRGFSVSIKDKSFYGNLQLNGEIELEHKTFVTSFKATTKKYQFEKMGYLIDDTYNINPFNLGGKRIIENRDVNLNKNYIKTKPVYLDEFIYKQANIGK